MPKKHKHRYFKHYTEETAGRQLTVITLWNVLLRRKVNHKTDVWAVTDQLVKRNGSSLELEGWGSNFGPVKSDTRVEPFLRKKPCCLGTVTRRWGPQTRHTLRRSTASILKDLICFETDVIISMHNKRAIQFQYSNTVYVLDPGLMGWEFTVNAREKV